MRKRLPFALSRLMGRSKDAAVEHADSTAQAAALFADFQQTGRLDLLDAAIELFQVAATGLPPDHPDWPTCQSNLGFALRTRFEQTGTMSDLDQAITVGRTAVVANPASDPVHLKYLTNLEN